MELWDYTQWRVTHLPQIPSQHFHTPGSPSTQSHSVIHSYSPSGMSALTPGRSTPNMQGAPAAPSPKPSPGLSSQVAMSSPAGALFNEQHASSMARHGGGSGSNSPVPSAFKVPPARHPSLSSLVMPNSAVLARPMGMAHGAASPQSSLPSTAGVAGLHSLCSALGPQSGSSPAPHFPAMSPSLEPIPPFPLHPLLLLQSHLYILAWLTLALPQPPPLAWDWPQLPLCSRVFLLAQTLLSQVLEAQGPTVAGSPVLSSLMGLSGAVFLSSHRCTSPGSSSRSSCGSSSSKSPLLFSCASWIRLCIQL